MTRTKYKRLIDELNNEFGAKKSWREHLEHLQTWVQKTVEDSQLRVAFNDI